MEIYFWAESFGDKTFQEPYVFIVVFIILLLFITGLEIYFRAGSFGGKKFQEACVFIEAR